MSSAQQLLAGGGAYDPPSKVTTSTDFDLSTYISRGTDLTSSFDSYSGSISFWFRQDGPTNEGAQRLFITNPGGYVEVRLNAANRVAFFVSSVSGSTYAGITSAAAFTITGVWHHVLASWYTNAAVGGKSKGLYVDNVLEHGTLFDAGAAATVDYTRGNWTIGATPFLHGCLSEMWFAPGQYIDFHQAANRAKFRNSAGHPIYLGADGSLPTGVAPAIYLANEYSTFQTNLGSGGDFTVTAGALTAGSSAP